jgi:hypothetical protein
MELAVIPEEEAASILKHPVEHGLCVKLMRLGHKAKNLRSNQVFGCRHCTQVRRPPAAPGDEANSTSGGEAGEIVTMEVEATVTKGEPSAAGEKESSTSVTDKPDIANDDEPGPSATEAPPQKARRSKKRSPSDLFIFDGLRSHLKGK